MNTPKFKKADWIKRKKDGRVAQVVMLLKTCYALSLTDGECWWLDYDFQDNWELTDAPPKNQLEEAAREYATVCHKSKCYPPCDEAFKAGAEWMKRKMLEKEDEK